MTAYQPLSVLSFFYDFLLLYFFCYISSLIHKAAKKDAYGIPFCPERVWKLHPAMRASRFAGRTHGGIEIPNTLQGPVPQQPFYMHIS